MKGRSCNTNLVPAKWRERLAISVNQKSFPDTESFDCQTKASVLACLIWQLVCNSNFTIYFCGP